MSDRRRALVVGAVAYDPKVVTIWDGFAEWFARRRFPFDFVLFSNYERQVDALFDGVIDVAWNSPLAWVRSVRRARAMGQEVAAIAMRDSDCDLTSVVVARSDSGIAEIGDLAGRTVAVGAVDSPQATLIPLSAVRGQGLAPGVEFTVRHHDIGVGKHGDHIGGEREAARALMAGTVDAACMIDGNHLLFGSDGTLAPGATRIVLQTPVYDHCNFTARGDGSGLVDAFRSALLEMDYADPEVRPLLDLEGLKEWRPGRTSGYAALERAVDELAFYDDVGRVTAAGYRPG